MLNPGKEKLRLLKKSVKPLLPEPERAGFRDRNEPETGVDLKASLALTRFETAALGGVKDPVFWAVETG